MSVSNRNRLIRRATSGAGTIYVAATDIKVNTPLTSTLGDDHGVKHVSLLSPFYQKSLFADTPCKHFRRRIRMPLMPLEKNGLGCRICKPIPCISADYFLASRHLWTCDEGCYATYSSLSSKVYDVIVPSSSLLLGKNRKENEDNKHVDRESVVISSSDESIISVEELFFKLRDPSPFDLPPPNDVASLSFWKEFKKKKDEYQNNIKNQRSCDSDDARRSEGNVKISRVVNPVINSGDQQHAPAHYGYAVTAVRDIYEGEEITLHRGLKYWTDRLLRKVFLCADTPELLRHVRWIEGLCLAPPQSVNRGMYQQSVNTDPFPSIVVKNMLCTPHRVKPSSVLLSAHDDKDSFIGPHIRTSSRCMRKVLWNSVHNSVARDHEVLAFAVRQSCLSHSFTVDVGQHFLHIDDEISPEGCHGSTDGRFLTMRDLRQLLRKDLLKTQITTVEKTVV